MHGGGAHEVGCTDSLECCKPYISEPASTDGSSGQSNEKIFRDSVGAAYLQGCLLCVSSVV